MQPVTSGRIVFEGQDITSQQPVPAVPPPHANGLQTLRLAEPRMKVRDLVASRCRCTAGRNRAEYQERSPRC